MPKFKQKKIGNGAEDRVSELLTKWGFHMLDKVDGVDFAVLRGKNKFLIEVKSFTSLMQDGKVGRIHFPDYEYKRYEELFKKGLEGFVGVIVELRPHTQKDNYCYFWLSWNRLSRLIYEERNTSPEVFTVSAYWVLANSVNLDYFIKVLDGIQEIRSRTNLAKFYSIDYLMNDYP